MKRLKPLTKNFITCFLMRGRNFKPVCSCENLQGLRASLEESSAFSVLSQGKLWLSFRSRTDWYAKVMKGKLKLRKYKRVIKCSAKAMPYGRMFQIYLN